MTNLFVFTAGRPEAYQHYIHTIENGFSLDSVRDYLPHQVHGKIQSIYGNTLIRAWGATPGSSNIRTWHKLTVGDPVLIYRKHHFEYLAYVTFKIHNKPLAKYLWGTNIVQETWEYVYFLHKLTEISVPLKAFNKIVGYKDNFIPQGFARVNEERIKDLKKRFGSVENFLKYLAEGKWIEKQREYPKEIREEIVMQRKSRQEGKAELLEANLEEFLVDRIDQIEPGLKLIERQVDTGIVGRLDLLCEDKEGNLVVVELKKSKAGPSIIDQTQRYMGWTMGHKARPGQKVRGIIIVGAKDTALEYAAKANPQVSVKEFRISFQ